MPPQPSISRFSESFHQEEKPPTRFASMKATTKKSFSSLSQRSEPSPSYSRGGNGETQFGNQSIVSLNQQDGNGIKPDNASLAEELDFITVPGPASTGPPSTPSTAALVPNHHRIDKASRVLGIRHRTSMEPIPASARTSIVSNRSARDLPSQSPTTPLTSLYVVSGLPKSPHTWTLADPDSVLGLHHTEGAVNRWWRPEVLGSTVSPGAGGGKKKRRGKHEEVLKGAGALSKQDVGKMLSKALKLSFTREVEVIASTLQPASTIHTFTFTLPAPSTPLAPSADLLRASVLSTDVRSSVATSSYPYGDDPFARPSTTYLGPNSLLGSNPRAPSGANALNEGNSANTVTYHGVCLTVWSHADSERSNAIRRTLEAGRSRKESAQSFVAARLKNMRSEAAGTSDSDPMSQARRSTKKNSKGPWGDMETDGETEAEGGVSESDFEVASTIGHGPGESTLFLPGDTVFWLPYALTLVSRHPIYDLMRDYLTLSWARFSKDVQSHTLQISKILAHPAPRAGELVRLDASPRNHDDETTLEVIARFPGGLDFGRGLVDINFTMWPLFKCLNIDNILTICEIALAPTGRILFFSRHPALLGVAVNTIKYLVELRGWNGIALPAVHSRDAKIYIEDPGPWILGLATEARYSVRPSPDVCVCDLDINYLSCPSPPPNVVSTKQVRDRYRQRLLAAFEAHYHPDHSVPTEFKEAFPAGRFRPVCKIQAKRGASSSAVADQIKPPEWWHSTRIIQAFDSVLQERHKKPTFFKRLSLFGGAKRPPQLTAAEQLIQLSIRKRATAFVDARDDLETKIGRLSRRLNFLMTESDLWRDKFVTFETYAEKLSAEAGQLRAKINKEQRETKRLSGLITLTAAEKFKLQQDLRDTEVAHQDAVAELEKMRENMETMEQERHEMVAEIEAQIERALMSMTSGIEDSDYGNSRPSSRLSDSSNGRSRATSDAASKRPLRSMASEHTLAEYSDNDIEASVNKNAGKRENPTIHEEDEGDVTVVQRFLLDERNPHELTNVDEGITVTSDSIAQKVLAIQQKLEDAIAAEVPPTPTESEVDFSEPEARPKRARKQPRYPSGSVASSTVSSRATSPKPALAALSIEQTTPAPNTTRRSNDSDQSHPPSAFSPALRTPSLATPTTPGLSYGTSTNGSVMEESDSDFQSAYSVSPRSSTRSLVPSYDDDVLSDTASQDTTEAAYTAEPAKHSYGTRIPVPAYTKPKQHARISSAASVETYTQSSTPKKDSTVGTRKRSGSRLSRDA